MVPATNQSGDFIMSETASLSDVSRYEQACDQAIAMCDGNIRSTIKALIMANEYLEAEMLELQAASDGRPSAKRLRAKDHAAERLIRLGRSTGAIPWPMSPITSRCHSCRTIPVRRSRELRKRARVLQAPCGAPKSCPRPQEASGRSPSAAPAIP